MRMLKRTYALPSDTLQEFEQSVVRGKRSAAVAEVLRQWLDRKRREQLRREVIEGCRDMAEVYLEIEQAYHRLEEEVSYALDAQPQTRRNRARSARPRRRV